MLQSLSDQRRNPLRIPDPKALQSRAMYPAPSARVPNGHLAAIALLKEKVHQGLPSKNPALYQGHEVSKSTTALGFQAALHLERVRSRYTGKERDTESGLDYFGARYYGSAIGRFMSPDWSAQEEPVPYAKLDDPQTLNLYSYVGNNPLSRVDADGHVEAVSDTIALAIIGGAAVIVAYETTPAGQRNIQNISNGTREIVGLTVTALENKLSALFSKGDSTAPTPADAKPQEPTSSSGGDTEGQRFRPADRAEDAGKKCVYCGRQTTEEPGKDNSRETDHGDPRSKGGNRKPGNRNPSCRTCNRQKGNKTIPQFKEWQRQNPDKVPHSMLFFPDLWSTPPWDEKYSDLKIAA